VPNLPIVTPIIQRWNQIVRELVEWKKLGKKVVT